MISNKVKASINNIARFVIRKSSIGLIIWITVLITVITSSLYFINFGHGKFSDDQSVWGTFGDYIGGVSGTIFNFTGVVLIYFTFKRQQETSVLQQFESTFFNLVNIHREMTKSFSGRLNEHGQRNLYEGAEFLLQFSKDLYLTYNYYPLIGTKQQTWQVIQDDYNEHFYLQSTVLAPYYRHLYHFIKYVDESDIRNKKKYMDILQAQMSDDELYCLFYNAISYGLEKVVPLLDKYSFLENIEAKSVAFDHHKKMFFPDTKFKYYYQDLPLSEV